MRGRGLLLLGAFLLAPVPVRSQSVQAPRFEADSAQRVRTTHPGVAFLASAALPGAGQYLLGAGRWVPYTAAEAWAVITYIHQRARAEEREQRYRDLAWVVARRVSAGPRRDGDFEYYEAMEQVSASGVFDREERRGGIQPETDTSTFNGRLWRLAQEIHIPRGRIDVSPDSPEYLAALDYYVRNAVRPEFAWAWGDADLEQKAFSQMIRESDAASRAAARALGVLLANHIASAVDALIAARLRMVSGGRADVRTGWEPGVGQPRFSAELRFSVP